MSISHDSFHTMRFTTSIYKTTLFDNLVYKDTPWKQPYFVDYDIPEYTDGETVPTLSFAVLMSIFISGVSIGFMTWEKLQITRIYNRKRS